MKLLTGRDAWQGGLIYASGDTIATLITGAFQWQRFAGMLLLGGTLYAVEIPAYFRWLDRVCVARNHYIRWLRALLALAFFNPLWIARHLAFIKLLSGAWEGVDWRLLPIAVSSFLHVVPAALFANFSIQNHVPLRWRFLASSLFSALMAIYFALSEVLFG